MLGKILRKIKDRQNKESFDEGYFAASGELLKTNGKCYAEFDALSGGEFNSNRHEYHFDKGIRFALSDWHNLAKERGEIIVEDL